MEIFIHFILIPSLYIFLLYIFYGRLIAFTFVHIFFYAYIVLIYIRAFEVFRMFESNYNFLLIVWIIPIIIITISGLIRRTVFYNIKKANLKVNELNNDKLDAFLMKYRLIIILYFPFILILFILDKGISSIALFSLVLQDSTSTEVMVKRIEGLNSNISPVLTAIYSYSRSLILPLFFAFLSTLLANKKIKKFTFIIVLITGVLFCLGTSAKSPAVIFLLSGILAYFLSRKGKIEIFKFAFLLFIILVFPAAIYPLLYGASGIEAITVLFENLWRRLTWVPSYASGIYFNVFELNQYKFGFSSNRFLALATGNEYISVAAYVYDTFFDSTIAGGLVNASFFAAFYADWGIYGVLLLVTLLGALLAFYDYYFNLDPSFFSTACKVVVIVGMIHLMLTNFYSVSLGRGFISIPLLLIIFRKFVR